MSEDKEVATRAYICLGAWTIKRLEWLAEGLESHYIVHRPSKDPHCKTEPHPTIPDVVKVSAEPQVGTQDAAIMLNRLVKRAKQERLTKEFPTFDASKTNTPECPKCGAQMVLRTPKDTDWWDAFWGCPNFPKCKGTRSPYFIYALTNPEGDVPFYVGMTKDPVKRFSTHLASGNHEPSYYKEGGTRKEHYINNLSLRGAEPGFRVLEYAADRAEARAKEDHWIMKLIQEGYMLTNAIG